MTKYKKNKGVICCRLLILLVFAINTCPVLGQVSQKKMLSTEAFDQWSTLIAQAISSDGNWTSYSVQYASEQDTLFVSKTDSDKIFAYPKGRIPKFAGNEWFACLSAENSLVILSLLTGKEVHIKNVVQFEFSEDGLNIVLVGKKVNQLQELSIINLKSNKINSIASVSSFTYYKDFSVIAYATCEEAGHFLKTASLNVQFEVKETLPVNDVVSKIVWQENGKSIAFALGSANYTYIAEKPPIRIGYYIFTQKKMYILDPAVTSGFPLDKGIALNYSSQLNISADGLRILLQLTPMLKTNSYLNADVEVWNGADNHTYPERESNGTIKDRNTTWVWHPQFDTLNDFISNESGVLLSGNQKMVLSFDFESCGPQFKNHNDRDCYLTDLTNRTQKLILSCHSGNAFHLFMSPLGKYVAYFKEGNWFSYEIKNEMHRNLTKDNNVVFYDEHDDKAGPQDVFIFAGWSKDDKYLFVYDQYDLWQINTDGSNRKRLTKGREKGIEYRVAPETLKRKPETFLSLDFPTIIDLKMPIILEANGYEKSQQGFSILEHGEVKSVYFDAKKISMLLKSSNENSFIFIEESYTQPPSLVFKKNSSGNSKTIFRSNAQQEQYFWSKNQTINYTTKNGIKLRGLLYYPVNYVADTLYPMIVNVYEQQFYLKNRYINPSLINSDGMNITNFVMNGYFVFLPDIIYEVGSPGDSALGCVTAGVEQVLNLNVVDASKIGLIGHSFGGYETTYIIGKSTLFAAAVAGASQTDLVSCYLTSGAAYQKPEYWRFEEYSNRMGKILFDDLDNYIYNSPVFNAKTILTPLLLWTGEKDGVVAPKQSMELYLALRRLEKEVVLLRYKNEYHSISDIKKQKDLTSKISNWFNHYLKNESLQPWMMPNFNP